MRAKKVYESIEFERGQDPKKSLGIGLGDYLVYDIEIDDPKEESFSYRTNWTELEKLLRELMPGISDNEIDRFVSFELNDIFDKIPFFRIKEGDLKRINDDVRMHIRSIAPHWMGMHSDRAMRQIARNSGLNI